MTELAGRLRLATLQWDIERQAVDQNRQTMLALLSQAVRAGADLICLPEMWTCSFCDTDLLAEACKFDTRQAEIADLARAHHLWIAAGSIPEPGDDQKVYNTFLLFDSQGHIRLKYRKIHLFPKTGEPRFFLPGDRIPEPAATGPWRIGVGICYDVRFPELFRAQMKKGANLFLLPAQFPTPRVDHFILLSQARALENLAYVAAVNRTGTETPLCFPGKSCIIDPMGALLAQNSDEPGLQIADLSADHVAELRQTLPFLAPTPILDGDIAAL
jgi:predicted amidohydrolase